MIQSLRNVMIEGTETLFEFAESAMGEVRGSCLRAPQLWPRRQTDPPRLLIGAGGVDGAV